MLEIYNEQVRDLLSKETPKGGLPVRQSPKEGSFYVQGLKKVPVQNYKEIEKRIEQGMELRSHFWNLKITYWRLKPFNYIIGTVCDLNHLIQYFFLNKIINGQWFVPALMIQ